MKKAIFPGSFDPITLGHLDIIHRAINLFDEIIVAVGINNTKKYMFSLEQRIQFLETTLKEIDNIKIKSYNGLTVNFCKANNTQFILRGLRNPADFEFEKAIAHTNRVLSKIETVFLLTSSKTSFISSSIVRDVITNGGDYSKLIPSSIKSLF